MWPSGSARKRPAWDSSMPDAAKSRARRSRSRSVVQPSRDMPHRPAWSGWPSSLYRSASTRRAEPKEGSRRTASFNKRNASDCWPLDHAAEARVSSSSSFTCHSLTHNALQLMDCRTGAAWRSYPKVCPAVPPGIGRMACTRPSCGHPRSNSSGAGLRLSRGLRGAPARASRTWLHSASMIPTARSVSKQSSSRQATAQCCRYL